MHTLVIFVTCWIVSNALSIQIIEHRFSRRSYNFRIHPRLHHVPAILVGASTSLSMIEKYGKGAEIFPPTNQFPLKLSDSFPGGAVPLLLDDESTKNTRKSVIFDDTSIGWIISSSTRYGDTILLVFSISLIILGFIRPLDLVSVACISGYTIVLSMLASSPRFDDSAISQVNSPNLDDVDRKRTYRPVLPALPPQGHVPSLFVNPLGHFFTHSDSFQLWLRIGAIMGLVAPSIAVVYYLLVQRDPLIASAMARPLFFICCQSIHENILRREITPLPIRILVPVIYHTVRLGPLYECMMVSNLGSYGKIFAIGSFLYWSAHLFGFLIPIGVMRYLRAHFFTVEAEEVKVHAGSEESVGLLP